MRLPVLLTGVLLLTAGCIGFGDDNGDNETDGNDTNFDGNDTDFGDSGDTGDAGDEAGESRETRNGTVEASAIVPGGGAAETFRVENGTETLTLELSADGGELEMTVSPADCDDPSCQETATTSGGSASYSASAPAEGEWTVTLSPASPGLEPIDYQLTIVLAGGQEAQAGFLVLQG